MLAAHAVRALLGYAPDTMDVQLYSFASPVLVGVWGISKTNAGLLTSATLVLLADRIGRVRMLQMTQVLSDGGRGQYNDAWLLAGAWCSRRLLRYYNLAAIGLVPLS
jgi:hypothetical protein